MNGDRVAMLFGMYGDEVHAICPDATPEEVADVVLLATERRDKWDRSDPLSVWIRDEARRLLASRSGARR